MAGDNLLILCNQKNFPLKNNGYKIRKRLPQSRVFFKQAVKDSKQGRPKKHMTIAVPNEIKENIPDVSPKYLAIIVGILTSKVLIINSYLPTVPKSPDFDTSELLTSRAAINDVI